MKDFNCPRAKGENLSNAAFFDWNEVVSAIRENNLVTIRQLITKDNVNKIIKNNFIALEGRSLLMIAAQDGTPETVKLLLEIKADINIENDSGYTALYFTKNPDIVKLLLSNGIDPTRYGYINPRDEQGQQKKLLCETAELFRAIERHKLPQPEHKGNIFPSRENEIRIPEKYDIGFMRELYRNYITHCSKQYAENTSKEYLNNETRIPSDVKTALLEVVDDYIIHGTEPVIELSGENYSSLNDGPCVFQ